MSFSSQVSEDGRASSALENGCVLPWGQPPERQASTAAYAFDVTPGEFVLRTLFTEFTVLAEKKIETILSEPLVSFCIILGFYCIGALDGGISERLESEIIFIFIEYKNRKFTSTLEFCLLLLT